MPKVHIPAVLTNLALDALEAEVACWRRIPIRQGITRLMRFPDLLSNGVPFGEAIPEEQEVVYHDVGAQDADNIVLRFAMEKVVEAVLAAIAVGDPE